MTKGTKQRSIRIDDELWEDAQRIAKERGDNLSDILRQALAKYVQEPGGRAMNVPEEAVQAAHAAICEQSLDDCLDPDWRGKCVKAVEAAAPYMLTTVSTVRELEALPRLTVIRTEEGTVYEKHTMWHEAGSRDLKYSPDIRLPATVLQVGWGEE